MQHESSSPWAIICKHKFKIKSNSSILVKCLKRGRDVFGMGVKHIIHSGLQTSLWHDNWLVHGPLRNLISGPLLPHETSFTVADVLTAAGSWKWDCFSFVFTETIYHAFISSPRNPFNNSHDVINWGPSNNGIFSVKSAYNMLMNLKKHHTKNLKWVWKLKWHPRHKFFILLICHNSLPTNLTLSNRGIALYPFCVLCGENDESVDHLFRTCPISLLIWNMCGSSPILHFSDFYSQLKSSASCQDPSFLNIPFGTVFIYCIWSIWLARNKKIFENAPIYHLAIADMALKRAAEFYHLGIDHSHTSSAQNPISVSWNPPDEGWFKINVDGACDPHSNNMVAEGLIRNHEGIWVLGFNQFLGVGNCLLTEAWGALLGIKTAYDLGFSKIWLESDCLTFVNLLASDVDNHLHHLAPIINSCSVISPILTATRPLMCGVKGINLLMPLLVMPLRIVVLLLSMMYALLLFQQHVLQIILVLHSLVGLVNTYILGLLDVVVLLFLFFYLY